MGQALSFSATLSTETCCNCGMQFAMPDDYQRRRRSDGKLFHCPAGHGQHYAGESDAAKIKRLEREAAAAKSLRDQARAEAEQVTRSNRALRGQATRLRKRIAAGVCPCCSRNFSDLGAHMTQKHPKYVETEVGG